MAQWLRLCAPNAGGLGLIPGQGNRSHMLQLRACMPQGRWKILCAATKTKHVEKQRHYFPDKGLYIKGIVFSSSHAWMWELDHKED